MNCKYCRANCTGAKHDREIALCLGYDPPKTNGDFIRSMSDEELAEWIVAIIAQETIYSARKVPTPDYAIEMRQRWLDWLRQECEP